MNKKGRDVSFGRCYACENRRYLQVKLQVAPLRVRSSVNVLRRENESSGVGGIMF